MATIIVLLVVILLVVLAFRSLKKNGKCSSCGCGCSSEKKCCCNKCNSTDINK
ncbi:FeoB-associated Cys-rich membrane protein [Bullifex porci]|uniref:FeoB-associated Cys-rich membrane protein n=1 Tax=Bullifex porci TaxID=2606638 RepID=UPI0023EFAABD|nr:FeoB-associated Cys-rich membrane protein [Bullifex porci]MDD7587752.1 FeoB-associated Cys-rich membrane protein [Bullifex porci]